MLHHSIPLARSLILKMDSKNHLRKEFRAIRSKIPAAYREQAGFKAAQIFAQQQVFLESDSIACYLPFKDEFDSSALIETIWHAKKKCYLPILAKDGKSLFFTQYQYGDALQPNRLGILEPIKTMPQQDPKKLDIVVTPLIAFDVKGHRLGTGGGYYDRTFAFILNQKQANPLMFGLAYAAQQAKLIPAEPWDILLQAVITENGMVDCR